MSELIISALGLGALYIISNQKEKKCETFNNRDLNPQTYTKNNNNIIKKNLNNKNLQYQEKNNWNINNIKEPSKNNNNLNNYKNNEWATKIYTQNNINEKNPNPNEKIFKCVNENNNLNYNSFSSLTGNEINQNDMKHNNMTPFYSGNLNPVNLNKGHDLENMTGVSSVSIKKEAIEPMFKPQKNLKYVNGAPNNIEFYKNRMFVSGRKDNYKPWDEVQVGPGLNKYDTRNGALGFNSGMESRECWGPKNIDQLRVLTNPKNSYCLNGNEGPAYNIKFNPGAAEGKSKIILGKMEKNRPDRYHENCGIENMGNARGIDKDTYRSEQMLTDENRAFCSKEYYGPGKSKNKEIINGNYQESNKIQLCGPINHVRVNNVNEKNINNKLRQTHSFSHNSRTTTQNGERFGLMNGLFKAAIAPIVDLIKPSKKEELINNLRQEGMISGGYNKQRTWDPNASLKTTIKEQTGLNKHALQPSKNLGSGYTTNEHQAIQNQRDTTNKPYSGLPAQNYGKGYLTNDYQPIQNQRDTTNMSYVSQPNKNNGVGYLSNEYQPIQNQRDTTNIFIIGGSGATKSTLATMKRDGEFTRPLPNKEECSQSRPNPGNMSLFNNKMNYQQLGDKCTYQSIGASNLPKQYITNDNFGTQRLKNINNQNINTVRMENNILETFKKNPYTHSLASI